MWSLQEDFNPEIQNFKVIEICTTKTDIVNSYGTISFDASYFCVNMNGSIYLYNQTMNNIISYVKTMRQKFK